MTINRHRTLDAKLKSLNAFIEYANSTKKFADAAFYEEIKVSIEALYTASCEAYQYIGLSMLDNDSFDQDKVNNMLDNLTYAAMGASIPHDDCLPIHAKV